MAEAAAEFAADVRRDLSGSPKQLQSKYLYDPLGFCLFDAICRLPWYRITGAERRLLGQHAGRIASAVPDPLLLVELGGGTGEKLAILTGALAPQGRPAGVILIDVSEEALQRSATLLRARVGGPVVTYAATYETGLLTLEAERPPDTTVLVMFLGSNIGNFDPPRDEIFLRAVRDALRPGDGLLLGADLVKPEADLLLAYDDPLEVTAAFNKNLLVRINRELQGEFDLAAFEHRAIWNRALSRVEMHLVSRLDHEVRIHAAGCNVRFEKGESIWTESSYKYDPERVRALGRRTGFRCSEQWIEPEARFALTLFRAV